MKAELTLHDLAKPGLYLVRELPREYERRDLLKKNAVEKLGKIQTGLFVCLPVCGLLGRSSSLTIALLMRRRSEASASLNRRLVTLLFQTLKLSRSASYFRRNWYIKSGLPLKPTNLR